MRKSDFRFCATTFDDEAFFSWYRVPQICATFPEEGLSLSCYRRLTSSEPTRAGLFHFQLPMTEPRQANRRSALVVRRLPPNAVTRSYSFGYLSTTVVQGLPIRPLAIGQDCLSQDCRPD